MDILSKSLQYRIRIFDNYNHLKTVNFKVMGQKYVTVIVDNPIFGEKTKMAFLIPPDVKPYNFGGKELEYNYDVREASPLSSIANICPNLILELNEDLEQISVPVLRFMDAGSIPVIIDCQYLSESHP